MASNGMTYQRLALLASETERAQEARAALLPRLDLGGQASRQIINTDALADTPVGEEFDVGGDVNFDTWQLALQAEWEVDLFGANRLRRDGAGRQVQSAEAQLVAVRLAVASNLAQGYVQARALLAQRALLDEGVRIARDAERVADGRFRLGEVTRLDVEAAGAQRAALEAHAFLHVGFGGVFGGGGRAHEVLVEDLEHRGADEAGEQTDGHEREHHDRQRDQAPSDQADEVGH